MEDRPSGARVRFFILAAGFLIGSVAVLLIPPGVQPLYPALVALVLVFATRKAAYSLLVACGCGVILLAGSGEGDRFRAWAAPDPATGGLASALLGPWHVGALIFTLLLGALASVLERSHGLQPLLRVGGPPSDRSRRRFLNSVFGLGLLCFFDGLANALMVGRVARPLADRLAIPRAFLAYIVDTTSSAVACVAFLSTWIVTQLAYISDYSPLDQPAYLQFLHSIPRNYYCLFALWLAFLAIQRAWHIGPMAHRLPDSPDEDSAASAARPGQLFRALVPLLVLVLAIPLFILVLFQPGSDVSPESLGERVRLALNASTVPTAFVLGSALALVAALAVFPPERWRDGPRAALQGAIHLLPALGILLLAWVLGSVLKALGTAAVLSELLGDGLPFGLFPAGVFLLGCAISFVSGTSWGTMGILMPIVLPTAGSIATTQGLPPEQLATVVPAVIGAVFGGAVFGDHCSPYSDTTIVSALASGVSTAEHTVTQLPYALLSAATALGAGYLLLALGLSHWLALLLGGGLLAALVFRPRRAPS